MNDASGFFKLCEHIGARAPYWVQGAGGNVSEKIERDGHLILRIKASGYRLDHVAVDQGFVEMDYAETRRSMYRLLGEADRDEQYSNLLAKGVIAKPKAEDRASMETGFHLVIERPLVAHFHSLVALLLADLYFKGDPRTAAFVQSLPETFRFLDYVKPGLDLSFAIQDSGPADVYILRNHGVILAMKSFQDILRWQEIEHSILQVFGWQTLLANEEQPERYWPLMALMPDTIVFMDRLLSILEESPGARGLYRLLNAGSSDLNLKELWSANVRLLATLPTVTPIPSLEWEAVAGMPVEKHRQKMNLPWEGP